MKKSGFQRFLDLTQPLVANNLSSYVLVKVNTDLKRCIVLLEVFGVFVEIVSLGAGPYIHFSFALKDSYS